VPVDPAAGGSDATGIGDSAGENGDITSVEVGEVDGAFPKIGPVDLVGGDKDALGRVVADFSAERGDGVNEAGRAAAVEVGAIDAGPDTGAVLTEVGPVELGGPIVRDAARFGVRITGDHDEIDKSSGVAAIASGCLDDVASGRGPDEIGAKGGGGCGEEEGGGQKES
jgi:hypothetical protein